MVTFPAEERHRPSTSTKLYCLVTEAHEREQLAKGCYAALTRWELNPWRPTDRKSNALLLRHYATHDDDDDYDDHSDSSLAKGQGTYMY